MTTNEAQNALLKMRTEINRAIQRHKDNGLSPGPLQMQSDALAAGINALEEKLHREVVLAPPKTQTDHA